MECTGCPSLHFTEYKEQLGSTGKSVFMVTYTCSNPSMGGRVVFRKMIDEGEYEEWIGKAPMPPECPRRE